jgi:tRNA modification GTPase
MFSTADTIVAIATPPGRGALGIVRLSGPAAQAIAATLAGREQPFAPRHATFAPAPRSSTGEECVEISAHGSPVVLASILRAAVAAGARLAEPGEFSLRAFLNGKRDLVQVEAVADLVDAVTPVQARAAFDQLQGTLTSAIGAIESHLFNLVARLEASIDFPDEGYHFIAGAEIGAALDEVWNGIDALLSDATRGRVIREGAIVTLAGAPNVGKSSLFNALLRAERAIVTATPGTTRDLLTERVDLGGLSVSLVDTAGLRDAGEAVEQEGVRRAEGSLSVSDLVLVVLDRSRPFSVEDARVIEATAGRPRLIIENKSDLPSAWTRPPLDPRVEEEVLALSVRTGAGLDELVRRITDSVAGRDTLRDEPLVTNVRHAALLAEARDATARARDAVRASGGALSEEFLLADLQDAQARLQEITGRRTSDEILRHIFERFCIGK